jgi:hypothetical protein
MFFVQSSFFQIKKQSRRFKIFIFYGLLMEIIRLFCYTKLKTDFERFEFYLIIYFIVHLIKMYNYFSQLKQDLTSQKELLDK